MPAGTDETGAPDRGARPGAGDRYEGPATLTAGGSRFTVEVQLRGHFQPIDGRYHWYGRVGAHEALTRALRSGRTAALLTTPEGSAPCDLSDPDPWQRFRVTAISAPPFATELSAVSGSEVPVTGLPAHVRVAVIGAGFSGLGAGIRLRHAGITDFVILERSDKVGGTWRDNSYPGCACDVPSHLYSFWSESKTSAGQAAAPGSASALTGSG